MPFWLHTSKAMLNVSRFCLWQKLVACIVLVVVALFIGFYGICIPLKHKGEQLKQNLVTLEYQKNLFQQRADTSSQSIQSNATLTEQLKVLAARHYTPQKTMAYLLELMQKHHISCRGIKPKSIIPKRFYEKHQILISGRGEFGKILAFLREIQDSNIVVSCKTLSIRKDSYRDLKFQLMLAMLRVKDV